MRPAQPTQDWDGSRSPTIAPESLPRCLQAIRADPAGHAPSAVSCGSDMSKSEPPFGMELSRLTGPLTQPISTGSPHCIIYHALATGRHTFHADLVAP